MKSFLNASLLLILFSSFFSNVALAQARTQCTFTAVRSGSFSDPTVFAVTGGSTCAAVPVSGSDAIIIIRGFDITLDRDFVIGKGGSITVSNNNSIPGTLTGNFNLTVGDGTGAQNETKLRIEAGSTVRVDQVVVNKADIFVAAATATLPRASLISECNLVLLNSSIIDDGLVFVRGNLDLSAGGANNTLCGRGGLAILGCVFGGNGAVNRVASNCAAALNSPTVCAQKSPSPGCPGPSAGTTASERACDDLVTSTGPCFTTVLPVELIHFSAVPNNQRGVTLRWVTASEKNSESFTVQHSADGRTFRDLGQLAGAGSVQRYTEYRFVDEQPLAGVSYYRLLQRDTDGTTSLSPVRVVKLSSTSVKGMEVYPGGTAQQWVVSTTLPGEVVNENASIQVIDAVGRIQRVAAVADAAQTGRWTLDLHTLPSGVYIVRLITRSGNFSQRIAK